MFYELAQYLTQIESRSAFFLYLTVRGVLAAVSAFAICFLLCRVIIHYSHRFGWYAGMREDGPDHHDKRRTPSLGGLAMFAGIGLSVVLWADLEQSGVWVSLAALLLFALIGALDDGLKIKRHSACGIGVRTKLLLQTLAAFALAMALYNLAEVDSQTSLLVPYMKDTSLQLGWWFVPFVMLVIVGCSNSVNLMDGLDGLCILPVVMIASGLAVFSYVSGNFYFASYLNLPYIAGNGEMALIAAALAGAGMGFLWFNAHPAEIFMGDMGSLSLGALLAVLAVIARQELVLAIMAGLFVVQTLSVMLQVGSYKLRGKRIFKMAPLHHHYEIMGWEENKVIVRFWIITFLLVILGLASLKIR